MVEDKIIAEWAHRVRVVHRYLENPRLWPDGIDHPVRWHVTREAYWRACAGHLTGSQERGFGWDGRLDDEAAYAKWADDGPRPAKLLPKPPDQKTKALKAVAQALVDGHLGGVVRLGAVPVTIPSQSVTNSVTNPSPGIVTPERNKRNKSHADGRHRGRPIAGDKPTAASERMRRMRLRKGAGGDEGTG